MADDQFDSMDTPGKLLPPEEYQDDSTEHPLPLDTWDSYEGATGTDKQGKKKIRLRNIFKSKSSKDKGETDKIPPDHRQELHRGEGTKRKKKESQIEFRLKFYPATKVQESSISGIAELESPRMMKKDLEEKDAVIKNLHEILVQAQNDHRKANQEGLQQHKTQDEIIKSEIDKEKSVSDKIRNMAKEIFEPNVGKHLVISGPVESEEKVQDLAVCRMWHEQIVNLLL